MYKRDDMFWTDAGAGVEFLRQQADGWVEQGAEFHRQGKPLSACWSKYHQQGWQQQEDFVQGLKLRRQRAPQSACANHEQRFAWGLLDRVLGAVRDMRLKGAWS